MDEPGVIAARLTATAKDSVDEARAIAKAAIADASDSTTFTAAKAVDSYMKGVELVMSSGLQAAKDVIGVEPPPTSGVVETEAAEGRRLVADALEAISRRMLRQTSAVAQETADELDKNPNGPTVWAKSLVKLGDIALLGGIELAETALIGPAPFEKKAILSDVYSATGSGRRRLKITQPAGIARPGTSDPIPETQLRYYVPAGVEPDIDTDPEAANGILVDKQSSFYLAVAPVGLISGVYVGAVSVVPVDAVGNESAALESFEVEVLL